MDFGRFAACGRGSWDGLRLLPANSAFPVGDGLVWLGPVPQYLLYGASLAFFKRFSSYQRAIAGTHA